MLVIRCQSLSSFRHCRGRGGTLWGRPRAPHCNLPWHQPQGGSLLGHHILSSPRGHHPQLPTTYALTTYLLPGLGKLTLLPISGYFLFLKHQPLSFPSLEQLKLNFLMVLSFQTKGWSLFLEYSFFVPSVVVLQGKVISYSMLRLFL